MIIVTVMRMTCDEDDDDSEDEDWTVPWTGV